MAQAPEGGGGAPRQNKTVKDFKGMQTQNRRNAIPEGNFAWLENIQPIGPGNLHSIPGRSVAVTRIPPPAPPPPACTDATERGQQLITIEDRFDQQNSFLPATNLRTSWGFIDGVTEEVYTLIGESSCGGGNMSYDATCCQINHFTTPAIVVHPALIDPNASVPAINCRCGVSDVPVYMTYVGDFQTCNTYYPLASTHVVYNIADTGTGAPPNTFGKKDNDIYIECNENLGATFISHHNAASGAGIDRYTTLSAYYVLDINPTAIHLVCLVSLLAGGESAIKRLLRSDGSLVDTFDLTALPIRVLGVVSDDLIYILCADSNWASLYYLKNFTDLVYVGNCPQSGFTPFGNTVGFFTNGSFYWGSNGVSGFSPDIFRIEVSCPEGSPAVALIPEVNRDSGTVAAGASIGVSWADVLDPQDQTIILRPAPVGGALGFGSSLATLVTGDTASGSGSFPIPGGTTPGSYVFMLCERTSSVYVATSPTFTVT